MKVALPDDYRSFLLEYNGGRFRNPKINAPYPNLRVENLDLLKGVNTSERWAEFGLPADLVLFEDNDPPQVLPIGSTQSGNLILIITHADDHGVIMLRTVNQESYWLSDGIEQFFELLSE